MKNADEHREPAHFNAGQTEGDLLCFALERLIHTLNQAPDEIEFTDLGDEALAAIKSEAAKLLLEIGENEKCFKLALDEVQVHICQMALDMLRMDAQEWLQRPDIQIQEPEKWNSVHKMSVAVGALFEKIESLTDIGRPEINEKIVHQLFAGFKNQ